MADHDHLGVCVTPLSDLASLSAVLLDTMPLSSDYRMKKKKEKHCQ